MPRTARASRGGYVYHVLNRGNARQDVFHKDDDFTAFVNLMVEANVNGVKTEAELAALQNCIARGAPYCDGPWQHHAAKKLGLEASLRPRGRPRKVQK